ncbi:hypothetical protein ACF0H5_007776 [Mactra antiquata]
MASNDDITHKSHSTNKTDTSQILEDHLRKKKVHSPEREKIVGESKEKAKEGRNSADANDLSRSLKERKLENFLRQKKRRSRRKRNITRSEVRAQAEKILEEFLQEQLRQQAIQTSSPEYQRYTELSVTENTTPSGDSSGFQSSSNALRQDSIPYADESDSEHHALRRTESVPHDELNDMNSASYPEGKGLPIHHEKSKSAPYSGADVLYERHSRKRPNRIQPPPPAPPGTPRNPSENSSESLSKYPVPYTGEQDGKAEYLGNTSSLERRPSPAKKSMHAVVPASLSLSSNPISRDRSNTPSDLSHNGDLDTKPKYSDSSSSSPMKNAFFMAQSGYSTSSESDSDKHHSVKGRKKKSMFKKAQERVSVLLKLRHKSKSAPLDGVDCEDVYGDHQRPKPKKRANKKQAGNHSEKHIEHVDESDIFEPEDGVRVIEDKHTHTNKHIHQTHGKHDQILRSTEAIEVIDTNNDKGKKHVEKTLKMKESSGGHHGGFIGKLRKLTTRDKSKKHDNMKGSKSSQWGGGLTDGGKGDYSRALSVPEPDSVPPGFNDSSSSHLEMYKRGRGFEFSSGEGHMIDHNTRQIKMTQVISKPEDENELKRHSSYLDIVDYSGNMVDRLYFDANGVELPRNKSFDYDQEVCVHETHVDDHGKVTVVRDVEHWENMEIDGDGDSREFEDSKDLSSMTEVEKEEVYGKIANRLAFIGDNFMSEKEVDKSRSVSPKSKLSDDQKGVEEEIEKTELTPLEQEIRDELRKFADEMDDKLAANARTAALRISGLVTYNHFKDAVHDSVGAGDGWAQVAAVFHITKRAIQVAGAGGALAVQIKEMSLKYIEDRFAGWIIGQGGWDSMLSEDESETDSELD